MIIVIADDLTGAVELGGIGLRYGLQVEVTNQIEVSLTKGTDLLIINTDTRSMAFDRAIVHLNSVLDWVEKLPYTVIFKKVDSVLRGYVLAEIKAQQLATGVQRALLLPANPRLGRTIRHGQYYIGDKAIHETNFSVDPEFPIRSANVLQILGDEKEVYIKSWKDDFPMHGLVIGELPNEDEMGKWMQVVPQDVLLAGASSAFIAFLEHRLGKKNIEGNGDDKNDNFAGFRRSFLYVCGSNYEKSIQRVEAWRMTNEPVCYLPVNQLEKDIDEQQLERWLEKVKAAIAYHQKAIIAFDSEHLSTLNLSPQRLRECMAKVVTKLLDEVFIQELVIEGGATAGAILAQRKIEQLNPLEELAPGVIRCGTNKDPKIWITLKPGSYNWYKL